MSKMHAETGEGVHLPSRMTRTRRYSRLLVFMFAAGYGGLSAQASDLYWDPNGTSAGSGGNGDWNLTDTFWTTSSDGVTGPFSAWNNATFDHAIFGGTSGAVTLTEAITIGGITFESSGYVIDGNTLTLAGAAPTIGYTGASTNNWIRAVLAGSNGVTFTGDGTDGYLRVTGANTITGGITIDSGARIIGTDSSDVFNGANNIVTVNSGGVLEIQNSNSFGGNTDASRLVLNDGAELRLGNHSLTHDVTLTGGTIYIQDPYGGGSATWDGAAVLTGDTILGTNNADGTVGYYGDLSDNGGYQLGIVHNGPGNMTLGGNNTFTGGITVNEGTVHLSSASSVGPNNVVTVHDGGGLQINNGNAFAGDTDASRLVMHDGSALYMNDQSLTHDITSMGGRIYMREHRYWRHPTRGSAWAGEMVLQGDTLLALGGSRLYITGNLSDNNGYQLSVEHTGDVTWLDGSNTFTGGITVDGGTLVLRGDGSGGAVGNVATVNGGTLQIEHSNAFRGDTAAANLIINDTGGLNLYNAHLVHDFTLTGGSAFLNTNYYRWDGTAVLTADTLLNVRSSRLLGDLTDNGAVLSMRYHDGDIWIDGGTHSYTGDTTIDDGAEVVLHSATTPMSTNSNVIFNGSDADQVAVISLTDQWPSFTRAIGTAAGEIQWTGTGGFYARDGYVDATVNLFGDGRTLTWGAGGFVPDGHALVLGTTQTNGHARELDFQNGIDLTGGTRTVRADYGNANDHAVISGVLSGTGGLQVTGGGLLELRGANTYSGPTIIGDAATRHHGTLFLGPASGLSPNTNLQLNGLAFDYHNDNSGFVIVTPASGDFTRPVGTGAGEVQWTNSGGFGAFGAEGTVNLGGAGATLTWGAGGFVPDGEALRLQNSFSNATLNWMNGIDLGTLERNIHVIDRVNGMDARLEGVIEGTGSLRFTGSGDIELNAVNTFTGDLIIGNGAGGGHDDTTWVFVDTLTDAGIAGQLGAGDTVVLSSHVGGLVYDGTTDASSNRNLVLDDTNGADQRLSNYGSGSLTWSGGVSVANAVEADFMLGGIYTTPDADGDGVADNPNVFSGVIADGAGTLNLHATDCGGGRVWRLTGTNTYTGSTTIGSGCTLEVTDLADGGVASSIGASAGEYRDLLLGNSTLRYIGSGDSTDRQIRPWTDSRLESSGTGALHFTSTAYILQDNGNYGHWLAGTNTDDNTFALTLADGPTPVQQHVSLFRLIKADSGLWALVTDNNAVEHSYTGNTYIQGGALRLDHAGAITGGLGATSSHGTAGSAQRSSLIEFIGPNNGEAGVIGLTAVSGGFYRGTTPETDALLDYNGTTDLDDDSYVQGVRWRHSGGFAAWDGTQVVNLFGDGRTVTWGADGFVPNGHRLTFGYETADGTVDFQNGIEFNSYDAAIDVDRGLADVDAILSGVLSGTRGLYKQGDGVLVLTGDNTYDGNTTVAAGVLQLGDGGTTGDLGASSLVTLGAGATLVANRSDDALSLNAITDGTDDGTLHQLGAGTTTLAASGDVENVLLEAGTLVASGAANTFAIENITFTDDGGAAFHAGGAVTATGGGATVITGGALNDTVVVDTGGSMAASGGLGLGNDVLDLDGTLDLGAGVFALADGDDTLTVRDNAGVTGTVDGGAGTSDTIELNSAAALTFDGTYVTNFEALNKTGAGTATVTGTQSYTDVDINAGVLDVDGTLEAPTVDLADGATLNVDGIVQAAGGTVATLTGDAGANTVSIATGGTLLATGDFGDGADTLEVFGTLDMNDGTVLLGAGDDTLTVTEDSLINGLVDGGTGTNTLNTHITGTSTGISTIDALQGFSALDKSGAGTLEFVGAPVSSFGAVTVSEGTLNVAAAGSITEVVTTAVDAGATLNVDGSYAGTTGADTFTAAGMIRGAGAIGLGDGDDRLVIQDTADFSGYTAALDGGASANDTIELNSASALTFAPTHVANFEMLNKTGAGTATLTGAQTYTHVDIDAGVLDVDDTLTAPTLDMAGGATLNVDGTVQAAGGTVATLTGDAGGSTVSIAAGGTLLATGDLGDGADTLEVFGTLDMADGNILLGAGDDTLTVTEDSTINGLVDGGAGTNTLNTHITGTSTGISTVDALQGFSALDKTGAGTLEFVGAPVSIFDAVMVSAGTVNVAATGSVTDVVTTAVDAGATLNVDGGYTGSTGADTFTVAGTVTGAGTVGLGDGDDELVLHDGADLAGLATLDAGLGTDTLTADIAGMAGVADINVATGFENLVKQNAGTLNINGAGPSSLQEVDVQGGTLYIDAASAVDAVTTTVAGGATLNVDGSYNGTAGMDTMDVTGTVAGAGGVALGDADDRLVLHDGANISALTGGLDGGNHVAGDTVALDIANSATFADTDTANFEILEKDNTGTVTLTGAQVYTDVNLNGGVLDVDDTLETPTIDLGDGATLNVDGIAQATGATQTAITGSADANTVMVNAGGTLLATGNLGDGVDTLDVAGTLDTGGGAFDLGAGDDEFVLYDGTTINGTVDGGAGIDTHVYDLDLSADLGALVNFEGLTKRGSGTLNINGPGASSLTDVAVEGGTLYIAAGASITDAVTTAVDAGATLSLEGDYQGSGAADSMTVAGVLNGAGNVGFGGDKDRLELAAGSDVSAFTGVLDGGSDTDTLILGGHDIVIGTAPGTGSGKQGAGSGKLAAAIATQLDIENWETVELAGTSTLTQHEALDLGANGLLRIGNDATWMPGSTTLTGSVANAGRIELGTHRVAISGDYASTGNTGVIAVTVSPDEGTAGGLDIDGDVTGTSTIAFDSDGSVLATPAEIVVVNSPNDDAGTPSRFVAEDTDDEGIVRIDGSVIAWNFEQKGDGSWQLSQADSGGTGLLPEVPGYSHTATLTKLAINDLQGAAFDRNTELRKCFHAARADADRNANSHCGRAWAQSPIRRIEVQRDGGFVLDGELKGGYVGADTLRRRDDGAMTFGAFMSFQEGDFDALLGQQTTSGSRVDFSTRQVGVYGGVIWNTGAYLDYNASFGKQQSTVMAGTFVQRLSGYTGSTGARFGYLFTPNANWLFDPYIDVMASKTDWQDVRDSANRDVSVSDDPWVVGKLGLRSQWSAGTDGWFSLWLDLDASQSLSGGESGAEFGAGGVSAGFDGAELGSWANARLGAAMKLGRHAELQAAVMASESFDKDDYTEEQAYLGLRIEW